VPTRNRWPILASTALVALLIVVTIGVALIPRGDHRAVEGRHLAAGLIFAGTYLAVAVGRIPGMGIDRAGIALVGAALMVACGAIPLDEAYKAVDLDTLTLLLGMMIVVAHLRLSGFLSRATGFITNRVQNPLLLLMAVIGLAGLLSAFLVNDAICLVMTPLIVEMARSSQRNAVPYLLAVAMGSNIGSVATITGNPQNMIIGSISHIPYADFAAVLSPVAVVGLLLTATLIGLFYRRDLGVRSTQQVDLPIPDIDPVMGWRALAGTVILLVLLFTGQPPAKAAIVIGALLLLTRRIESQRVYAQIDWSLLLMFAGLFITVSGAERSFLGGDLMASARSLRLDQIPVLSGATAIISNLVSNVPAVLLLKPMVASLPDQRPAWLTVAMASTLAGNFTLIGSIANLLVVQGAAAQGVDIRFWDYFKVGAPLTLLTLTVGTLWLWLWL
jgi:Na+/H+ antiporter NhaD/arsenite permease-like protein